MRIAECTVRNIRASTAPRSGVLPSEKQDRALKKACQDFESLLVAQMLHSMRSTVEKSDLFGSRDKEELWQGMMDDEVAKQISRTGAFGIGDLIYRQLSAKSLTPDPSVPLRRESTGAGGTSGAGSTE
jgi:flagellar protein FlgJ